MTSEEFFEQLKRHNIVLSDTQLQQFEQYYQILIETNRTLNLTAITERSEVYLKHFFDSVIIANFDQELQTQPLRLADVGTGAGFPGIPLKIAFPQLQLTLIDALQKRLNFLQSVSEQLGLRDIQIIHGRAEDLGNDSKYRETFDRSTARAVAKTSVLSEYLIPFVKIGGKVDVMKSTNAENELNESKNALSILGGRLAHQFDYEIPGQNKRVLQIISKEKHTPAKFPRKAGTPSKKPLN